MDVLEPAGRLFYIVSPNRTTFENLRDVPNYADAAYLDLVGLFILEICISKCLRKSNIRINATIACLSQAIFFELARIFAPGGGIPAYVYIYNNWRIVTLPWNSLATWWISFLGVDFAYYWLHRTAHSVNIIWATHQVHHSSEDYNISVNTRQSILQLYSIWVLYLPLAFFMSPAAFVVHIQFNYIYQFWIHTSLIRSLGPLEYILNTPSHHRVHHGANRECIDRNFGGTLIIWDKLFGTFTSEKEEIVYGLTQPVGTFELMHVQFSHCVDMWKKIWEYKGWTNKLSVLFKGPGWSPGKPWLGDPKDIPMLKAPAKKFDPNLPFWCKIYSMWHFLLIIQGHGIISDNHRIIPGVNLYTAIIFEVFSLVCLGVFLDRSAYAPAFEFVRCAFFFVLDFTLLAFTGSSLTQLQARWFSEALVRATYLASLLLWMFHDLSFKRTTCYPQKYTSKKKFEKFI